MDDDEDVVLRGSALYQHLVESGFQQADITTNNLVIDTDTTATADADINKSDINDVAEHHKSEINHLKSKLQHYRRQVAELLLKSQLLVVEDEDFIKEFVLESDEDVPLITRSFRTFISPFSLTLAAASLAVPILLTKAFKNNFPPSTGLVSPILATTATSVFAVSIVRKLRSLHPHNQIISTISQLLETIQKVKTTHNQGIHFLLGMEMVRKYFHQSHFGESVQFLSLRQSIFNSSLSLIKIFRCGTQKLLSSCPLVTEYDHGDHYIANVSLDKFGLDQSGDESFLETNRLKDVTQVLLLMESEFLRRLSLCFCLELRNNIHNTDWMKTVKNICDNIIEKAESSLEQLVIALKYSKAMGFSERRSSAIPHSAEPCILRPGITQTCYHLQNCLIKLREMEESNAKIQNISAENLMKVRTHLEQVSTEIRICQETLEDSIDLISNKLNPDQPQTIQTINKTDDSKLEEKSVQRIITEDEDLVHQDEVFEAIIRFSEIAEEEGDDLDSLIEDKKKLKESSQAKKVLSELRSVLVHKQNEWKIREGKALARQKGEEYVEEEDDSSIKSQMNKINPESFDLTAESFTDSDVDEDDERRTESVGHQLLKTDKLFKRPKKASNKPSRPQTYNEEAELKIEQDLKFSLRNHLSRMNDNVLKDKEGRLRTFNVQPIGFDNRLATEAIKSRLVMMNNMDSEECFGDSGDSDE